MTDLEGLPVAGTVVVLRPGVQEFDVLLMRRPDRGSFAGAWVFPGGKVEDADRRPGSHEIDDARRAGIRETFEEVGLRVDDLEALSRWQPPAEVPTRIRTWFFLGRMREGDLRVSADEVMETVWVSPAEALRRHAAGEWMLVPPTWVTLHQLSRFDGVDSAMAAAGEPREFTTRVVESARGTALEWGSLRLETGSLPWRISGS